LFIYRAVKVKPAWKRRKNAESLSVRKVSTCHADTLNKENSMTQEQEIRAKALEIAALSISALPPEQHCRYMGGGGKSAQEKLIDFSKPYEKYIQGTTRK
jgi:hypothetical protein